MRDIDDGTIFFICASRVDANVIARSEDLLFIDLDIVLCSFNTSIPSRAIAVPSKSQQ
jgi:hypothetical protein